MQSLTACGPSPASARFFRICAKVLQPVQRRHESTYRRQRSKLNIKPDPSFLPTKTEQHDHIIYNPPPSMPNVYHTPTIFLPLNDKRRAIQAALKPYQQPQVPADQLPHVRKTVEKAMLTQDQVDEMRQLRLDDPAKWTQTTLSKKYNCSTLFTREVIKKADGRKPRSEMNRQQKVVQAVVRSNWGPKRRIAREDRAIRRDKWFRDE